MTLRTGIIGTGVVAAKHADAYRRNPNCQVTAVAEINVPKGEKFAAAYDARFYADYNALIQSGEVDAVSICVPHYLHCEIAVAAAAAQLHILLEKPISNTLEEADQILNACARANITLMLSFVHRFRSEVMAAKALLSSGRAGKVVTALDSICTLGGNHPPAWVWQREMAGGGVLMYGGIHSLDRLRWLLTSEVVETYAYHVNYHNHTGVEDGLAAVLNFENGAIATLFENSPAYGKPGGWLTEIYGDRGAVRLKTGEWVEFTSAAETFIQDFTQYDHFQREIDEFVGAILEKRSPLITGEDGRKALAVALAIYQSAQDHRPVRVIQ